MEAVTRLRLPTHPATPSPPPIHPPTPLIHTVHDITVTVKKVAENPALLASYVTEIAIRH